MSVLPCHDKLANLVDGKFVSIGAALQDLTCFNELEPILKKFPPEPF